MPLMACAVLVGALIGVPFDASGSFGRWALTTTVPVLAWIGIAGYFDSRRLVSKRLDVYLPRLPASFDGLKMVQISDLHVGPHTSREFLKEVKERVMKEEPDLVAITGDQVDDFAQDVDYFNAAFGELEAPCGVFAVPGNHDVYAGWGGSPSGIAEHGLSSVGQ